MDLMQMQYKMLQEAMAGYERTGIPLVAFDGTVLKPAGIGDDVFLYFFIPKFSHHFGFSLDQSIHILLTAITLVSFVLGIIGLLLYFNKRLIKWLGIVELGLLTYGSYFYVGGIYVILSSIVVAVVPLFLYFSEQPTFRWRLILFLLFVGTAIGMAHHLRSHAGTGVLIFMIIILLFYLRTECKRRILLVALLIISFIIPKLFFDKLLDRRDAYLQSINSNYESALRRHPLWHTFYIGFGFLNNEYGIMYKDEDAIRKVKSSSGEIPYLSYEYERTLRNEVFQLIINHPLFAARTVFAKLGVIVLYLLMFGNVGVIAAAIYRKKWQYEIAFWCGMVFSSLFGVLAVPTSNYLLGLVAFTVLYGIMSIAEAAQRIRRGTTCGTSEKKW